MALTAPLARASKIERDAEMIRVRRTRRQFAIPKVNSIGILIFDDVEELDFVGPLEVFGMAVRLRKSGNVTIVAHKRKVVRCRHGLKVVAQALIPKRKPFDLLIVPGGLGARTHALKNEKILEYVSRHEGMIASVCTGALILGAAGLLKNQKVTTHHSAFNLLRRYSGLVVRKGLRMTANERIWTSAGISAGIDMSLALVSALWGERLSHRVANALEWSERTHPSKVVELARIGEHTDDMLPKFLGARR